MAVFHFPPSQAHPLSPIKQVSKAYLFCYCRSFIAYSYLFRGSCHDLSDWKS